MLVHRHGLGRSQRHEGTGANDDGRNEGGSDAPSDSVHIMRTRSRDTAACFMTLKLASTVDTDDSNTLVILYKNHNYDQYFFVSFSSQDHNFSPT